jgi:phage terminase large subunit-like protein
LALIDTLVVNFDVLKALPPAQKKQAMDMLKELHRRKRLSKIQDMYVTAENRAQYPRHMEFFANPSRQRLMLAGNRVGKTEGCGGYEVACHMTGLYPEWWVGKRFAKPVNVWVGGDTATTVRDIIQQKLLGNFGDFGTGLVLGSKLSAHVLKRGVPEAVEMFKVKSAGGGYSIAQLKSYDQGREAWQGTEQDIIWLDEEPPIAIYLEALIRTMTTQGIVLGTFTPMKGMTEITTDFMSGDDPSKWYTTCTWDEVGHLSQADKDAMWRSIPIELRDARSRGIPTVGKGLIYPTEIDTLIEDYRKPPREWVKGYALDVGWNKTAAVWGALDDENVLHIYDEHYQGEQEPKFHADQIKLRGKMTGWIDPASRGRTQNDGQRLLEMYRKEGLMLVPADNAVSAGIFKVFQRMQDGQLKIARSCQNLIRELKMYHRDEKGAVVKKNDHAADALRYLVMALGDLGIAETEGNYATTSGGSRYLSAMPLRARAVREARDA